jgi:hypothetical protein
MPIECYRKIIEKADSADIEQGRDWYKAVHKKVLVLAAESGYSPEQVAGVIAVLSPNVEWNLNLRAAGMFLKAKGKIRKGIPGYHKNRRKAKEVLEGNLDAVRGPKVRAFYNTLLDPEHAVPVIDTQMIAAFFEGTAYRDDFGIVSSSEKRKEPMYQAVKQIAKEKKWTVSETQGVIWTCFKIQNGPYAMQLKLFK